LAGAPYSDAEIKADDRRPVNGNGPGGFPPGPL